MFPSEYTHALYQQHLDWGIASRGKVFKHMEHGFFYALDRPQQREFLVDILKFIRV